MPANSKYDLIGQKNATPEETDGTRIFYESLYEAKPDSKFAEKWLLEHGCFSEDQAKEAYTRLFKS